MAGIIIVNGPFGSGKTTVAGALTELLQSSLGISIGKVADGPHLVHEIIDVAHGIDGSRISDSHYHPWVGNTNGGHNHVGLDGAFHFPFTVRSTDVTDAMIRAFLLELMSASQNLDPDLIIAELGTGIAEKKITQVELSTTRFLQIAGEQPFWGELKAEVTGIVAVNAGWKTRLERNVYRPHQADGVNKSWGMKNEAMSITRKSDFAPWKREFSPGRIVHINNNFPMDRMDETCLRRLEPVLSIIESNLTLPEGQRRIKKG